MFIKLTLTGESEQQIMIAPGSIVSFRDHIEGRSSSIIGLINGHEIHVKEMFSDIFDVEATADVVQKISDDRMN